MHPKELHMIKLVAFDLDGTLAESKQAIEAPMAGLLGQLLKVAHVAIISGGDWPQFEKQVVARLPEDAATERLFIMPTTGTKLYRYQGDRWSAVYADLFEPALRDRIVAALADAAKAVGLDSAQTWGDQIEDRGSQITFSALGQQAPAAEKAGWDPDIAKRKAMQAILRAALPELSINIGGTTSIDVTRAGVDKASGLRRLSEETGIATSDMLFMGDAMYPGGNDEPVARAGIASIAVRDVAETETAIRAVIACLTA
jgi:phosphomannomutase